MDKDVIDPLAPRWLYYVRHISTQSEKVGSVWRENRNRLSNAGWQVWDPTTNGWVSPPLATQIQRHEDASTGDLLLHQMNPVDILRAIEELNG